MVAQAAQHKPRFLYFLAAVGLMLGSFGAMFSVASALPLLESRDRYIAAVREVGERQLGPELGTRDERSHLAEREGETTYARRGAILPIAAINIVLSILLFTGTVRAMRGMAWGLSAWSLAATASIPYTALAAASSMVQIRDFAGADLVTHGALGPLTTSSLALRTLVVLSRATLEILYFGICLVYLRRPSIQKLYPSTVANRINQGGR